MSFSCCRGWILRADPWLREESNFMEYMMACYVYAEIL